MVAPGVKRPIDLPTHLYTVTIRIEDGTIFARTAVHDLSGKCISTNSIGYYEFKPTANKNTFCSYYSLVSANMDEVIDSIGGSNVDIMAIIEYPTVKQDGVIRLYQHINTYLSTAYRNIIVVEVKGIKNYMIGDTKLSFKRSASREQCNSIAKELLSSCSDDAGIEFINDNNINYGRLTCVEHITLKRCVRKSNFGG